ncbi:hypothetical protein NOS3756_40910 [Nostoc sp. NIES-3756]|nr:hypothetical protein NOS3756_40910 [Nostoc sp. NIES-3756]
MVDIMEINSESSNKNLCSIPTTNNLETLANDSQLLGNADEFLLPRSAWNSQVAYLRAVFRAKKALDKIELAAEWLPNVKS